MFTPLKVQTWTALLARHPDREFVKYILSDIIHSFRIGFNYIPGRELHSVKRNMQLEMDHSKDYLQDGCAKQRVAGPYPYTEVPGVHINRFGVIPNKSQPGKWKTNY